MKALALAAALAVQAAPDLPAEDEARARLRNGALSLHPQAEDYLQRAWERRVTDVEPRPGLFNRLTALFSPQIESENKVDPQLLAIITFLENELEVNSER